MRPALFFGACLFILTAQTAQTARAKSETDQDTDDRHGRASSSDDNSSSSSSSSSYDDDHHCCWQGADPTPAYDTDQWTAPPVPLKPISADLLLQPRIALDHPGGGFAFDLGLPYFNVDELRRTGLAWTFELSYTRWLDRYRPEGAQYTSTMDLLRLSTGLYYRYTWLSEAADITLAVGPGFTMVRAFESFDDATHLNETLFAGMAIGPTLHIDLNDGLFGGRAFVEAGVDLTAGWTSPYLHQYDSLISGVGIFMVRPHASAGHFWELSSGVEVGFAYEVETVGGLMPAPTLAHTGFFAIRLFSYVQDSSPAR